MPGPSSWTYREANLSISAESSAAPVSVSVYVDSTTGMAMSLHATAKNRIRHLPRTRTHTAASGRFHAGGGLQGEVGDAHFAQLVLLHLAGDGGRVLVHEPHIARHLVAGDPVAAVVAAGALGAGAAGLEVDPRR